jgi:hypothetical protein
MCHYFQKGKPEAGEKFTGWKGFLAANPDRKA